MNVEVLVTGFGPSGRVLIGLISGATLPHIKYVLKSENSNKKNHIYNHSEIGNSISIVSK